jgi:hypothetical protein
MVRAASTVPKAWFDDLVGNRFVLLLPIRYCNRTANCVYQEWCCAAVTPLRYFRHFWARPLILRLTLSQLRAEPHVSYVAWFETEPEIYTLRCSCAGIRTCASMPISKRSRNEATRRSTYKICNSLISVFSIRV